MATSLYELAREVNEGVLGKVEVVEIDIERSLAEFGVGGTQFFGVVEQEVGFDGDEPIVPIDLVHQHASSGHLHMLDEIVVCFIKSL